MVTEQEQDLARTPFAERLAQAVMAKNSRVCVGLDPVVGSLPAKLRQDAVDRHGDGPLAVAMAFLEFGRGIIDAVAPYAPVIKPQAAFFEACGPAGMHVLHALIQYGRQQGLLVILDGKRGDIGSTAEAYADAHLGRIKLAGGSAAPGFDADALTVNVYLGRDGLAPFIAACREHHKGIFALVRTSNPSAGDLQDLEVTSPGPSGTTGPAPVYLRVASMLAELSQGLEGPSGYSPVGAVVGATYPQQAVLVRQVLPRSWFLVPGYGAQGATASDVAACFDPHGLGAVVNSSRGIIFASGQGWAREAGLDWQEAAAQAARRMQEDLNQAMAARGTPPG